MFSKGQVIQGISLEHLKNGLIKIIITVDEPGSTFLAKLPDMWYCCGVLLTWRALPRGHALKKSQGYKYHCHLHLSEI